MSAPYGTIKYYKDHFMDILADAACEDTTDENMPHVENILEGFQEAITEWLKYHAEAAQTYEVMLKTFLDVNKAEDLEAQEAALPSIPAIPSIYK